MAIDILSELQNNLDGRARDLDPEIFILRGVWKCQYVLQLTAEESIFNLNYILSQTVGQGCCHFESGRDEPILDESFIGKNIQNIPMTNNAFRISALDAVYSSLNGSPDVSHKISGSNIQKAHKRAEIVCSEALRILRKKRPKHGARAGVLNVGVVGSFLSILSKRSELNVMASDLYKGVVGKTIHGIQVENGTKVGSSVKGDRTLELVADADVAIVTGMTLANNTLGGILSTALENKTSLVVFAETGSNFAHEYCMMGVDAVVSEPFPFYLTGSGPVKINVYRKND